MRVVHSLLPSVVIIPPTEIVAAFATLDLIRPRHVAAVLLHAPAKTVADCFKYRHKLGLDIAVEALRRLARRSDFQSPTLLEYARVCQVETVLRPYLEALL